MKTSPPAGAGAPGALRTWLEQRRVLLEELSRELRHGFQAVAAFDGSAYLDSIERQEELCRRIAAHDRDMPPSKGSTENLPELAEGLRRMNAELKKHADVQAALIEHGSRSLRSFQRIWALNAPFYGPPTAGAADHSARKPPAAAGHGPAEPRARDRRPPEN